MAKSSTPSPTAAAIEAPNLNVKRSRLGTYDYPTSYRLLEVGSLAAFAAFGVLFTRQAAMEVMARLSWPTTGAVTIVLGLGYVLADFLSGLVHFLFDNFGSVHTPIIGRRFIKPFRDHHEDPAAMTRADAIAVNADNCLACLPILVPLYFLLDLAQHPYVGMFVVSVLFFTMLTNQLHKWAHMPELPRVVRALQRTHLVLSVEHHQVHHTAPFDTHYCITWGILNPLLERVGFWKVLTRILR